ncbi:hypothetical protein [Paraburkholderia sp. BL21I4N1]|nr:hypothetical protein [Paraburkholderia sp. BL21I4N1]
MLPEPKTRDPNRPDYCEKEAMKAVKVAVLDDDSGIYAMRVSGEVNL